jgi:hypothetical protein
VLPLVADACCHTSQAPAPDKDDAPEEVSLHIYRVEAVHVARRVYPPEPDGKNGSASWSEEKVEQDW